MEYNRREILKAFEDNKEYIKKASADGIRNNRMGKCSIRITDNNGIPLPNVPLHIEQKSHNFKYGANIFMLDEFETEEKIYNTERISKKYVIWLRCRFIGMSWSRRKESHDSLKTARGYTEDLQ